MTRGVPVGCSGGEGLVVLISTVRSSDNSGGIPAGTWSKVFTGDYINLVGDGGSGGTQQVWYAQLATGTSTITISQRAPEHTRYFVLELAGMSGALGNSSFVVDETNQTSSTSGTITTNGAALLVGGVMVNALDLNPPYEVTTPAGWTRRYGVEPAAGVYRPRVEGSTRVVSVPTSLAYTPSFTDQEKSSTWIVSFVGSGGAISVIAVTKAYFDNAAGQTVIITLNQPIT